MKKILVPGGTGVMGTYLVPELLKLGYAVDVVSLDARTSDNPNLRYFTANFLDDAAAREILANDYDGMVDFMRYSSASFPEKCRLYCENVGHYVHLSSYRVYADEEHPVRETSPRLLDTATEAEFLATDDYCLCKARNENTLRASGYTNWTAVRPAVIFSTQRFQLVTMEADVLVPCARSGMPIAFPEEAADVHAAMCWGGDAAKMIALLVLNDAAKGEIYTIANGEAPTWSEIAGYYRDLLGLKTISMPAEEYLKIRGSGKISNGIRWQLAYDRLFDRTMDNSKILAATGLTNSDFVSVYDGLRYELSSLTDSMYTGWNSICETMRAYLDAHNIKY